MEVGNRMLLSGDEAIALAAWHAGVALGAGYPIRFFSSGPNIPGDFAGATAEKILNRQFPRSLP